MAEALLRSLAGDRFEVASAGIQKTSIHPLAIRVMSEVSIDTSGHASKALDAVLGQPWDYVITVCDDAKEKCPAFPERTRRRHWRVVDPSLVSGPEDEKLADFRWARDELRELLREWLADQQQPPRGVGLFPLVVLLLIGSAASAVAWWALGWASGVITAIVVAIAAFAWFLWRA
jgi:arsenate reductase